MYSTLSLAGVYGDGMNLTDSMCRHSHSYHGVYEREPGKEGLKWKENISLFFPQEMTEEGV